VKRRVFKAGQRAEALKSYDRFVIVVHSLVAKMASQTQGIQQLLAAEKRAAEKVSDARKRECRCENAPKKSKEQRCGRARCDRSLSHHPDRDDSFSRLRDTSRDVFSRRLSAPRSDSEIEF